MFAVLAALALGVGAGPAHAVLPPCVVLGGSGQCAPPGYLTPNSGATTNDQTWDQADGTHCYRGTDSWSRGSTGYNRQLVIHGSWCSNKGQSQLISFSYGYELPHQFLCSPGTPRSYIVSGGIGYSWETRHYEVNYSCQLPFGSFSDRIWFNVRYGTYGLHYMTDWN
ncbi:MAG: hypothetical protein ACXVQ4_05905 [Gaiellaceae bacterium]